MKKSLILALVVGLFASGVQADSVRKAGDIIARAGLSNIDPDSDGSDVTGVGTVRADDATMLTFNGTYMVTDNFGVELLASLPFEHDVELNGDKVGETKHLPPTLSAQFHLPLGNFVPYVGAGINYTVFFDQTTTGALEGTTLNLDASLGLAGQVGLDYVFDNNWLVNFEVRYIDIDTRAQVNGTSLGDVSIDPWLYGLNVGYQF